MHAVYHSLATIYDIEYDRAVIYVIEHWVRASRSGTRAILTNTRLVSRLDLQAQQYRYHGQLHGCAQQKDSRLIRPAQHCFCCCPSLSLPADHSAVQAEGAIHIAPLFEFGCTPRWVLEIFSGFQNPRVLLLLLVLLLPKPPATRPGVGAVLLVLGGGASVLAPAACCAPCGCADGSGVIIFFRS